VINGSLWETLQQLLPGLGDSLQLAGVSTVVGVLVGLLLALLATRGSRWISWPTIVLIEIGRGAPVLVVLLLVYYGLPSVQIVLEAKLAAWIGLSFTTAAYSSEILRAGLLAVPDGQREAARALGLSRSATFFAVVLPQAIRISLAPLLGFCIQMFQATSLAFALGLPELLSRAYDIGSITFQYLQVLVIAGAVYAIVTLPLIRLVARLERRSARARATPTPTAPAQPTGAS
jgi:polar amino acid transport system permease protein